MVTTFTSALPRYVLLSSSAERRSEERQEFQDDYTERLLNPYVAAERGYVDAVIDPAETRREVAAALQMLDNKRERLPHRKHGNEPL